MSTRIAQELISTPPRTWEELAIMWAENFAILKNATIADHILTTEHLVENTAVEIEIIHAELKADELMRGLHIRAHVEGIYSNASASDDFTVRYYINGTLLHEIARAAGNKTDTFWEAMFEITVLSEGITGTLIDSARLKDGQDSYAQAEIVPHAVDTTVELEMRITVQWDAAKAGNILRANQGHFEFIKGTIED